ncbi:uncharacterized protein TA10490 [Theileria annulata]|uniref:CCZ1/INTU/HSP4 first Longin domain-containing protein n=1 Tax=Theileria annulata TaxID=5874 RepID=Q4U8Z9_THEAN|nr:uncharacterized protein TA10490 [Theileria annulata]CAI76704.1 hypothetical protein TA10490 [Theileria annulata]|eukprot:XP_953329.1 hypothetical protein TA10490 [Theileria annulata]
MSDKPKRVDAIFVFDLNRKSDLDYPSDKDIQLSKLLYYHPEDRSVDDKLSHFGLIEGLITLSNDEMTLESLQEMLENILPTFMNNSTKTMLNFLKDVEAFKKFHTNMNLSLDIQLMIDDLYNEFEPISKSLLIYNQQVLHYSMELDEVFLIYCYIVRYMGNVSKVNAMNVKWPENNEVTIVDSMEDSLFSPQIYINNVLYTLTIISVHINRDNKHFRLKIRYLVLTNTKFFALNSLSKTINSVGFDSLNNETIEELSMIYDLHDILSTCREQLYNTHIKTKNSWISTKFNNSRLVFNN